FLPQIQNALHYSYSNGPLECLNNHIKVLKRNAYGFRNFYNFKRKRPIEQYLTNKCTSRYT
ncbi:transposase, partial [Enterococcus faecium]